MNPTTVPLESWAGSLANHMANAEIMILSVKGMTLFEALSALVDERQSGRLQVAQWDGKEGVIGLNDGRIVHCQYLKRRGADALKILRNWISVSFRFLENVEMM